MIMNRDIVHVIIYDDEIIDIDEKTNNDTITIYKTAKIKFWCTVQDFH